MKIPVALSAEFLTDEWKGGAQCGQLEAVKRGGGRYERTLALKMQSIGW